MKILKISVISSDDRAHMIEMMHHEEDNGKSFLFVIVQNVYTKCHLLCHDWPTTLDLAVKSLLPKGETSILTTSIDTALDQPARINPAKNSWTRNERRIKNRHIHKADNLMQKMIAFHDEKHLWWFGCRHSLKHKPNLFFLSLWKLLNLFKNWEKGTRY